MGNYHSQIHKRKDWKCQFDVPLEPRGDARTIEEHAPAESNKENFYESKRSWREPVGARHERIVLKKPISLDDKNCDREINAVQKEKNGKSPHGMFDAI